MTDCAKRSATGFGSQVVVGALVGCLVFLGIAVLLVPGACPRPTIP